MAKLVFEMNQSLDGYVDHTAFAPGPTLFRHFIQEAQGQAGSLSVATCRGAVPERTMVLEMGYSNTSLPAGVAEPAEMGRLALVEVGRSERQTC